MFFVAVLIIAFCLFIGLAHPELVKTLLFLSWVAMALMAIGAILYSLLGALF